MVDGCAKTFTVSAHINIDHGYPPTINASTPHVQRVAAAASKVVGSSYVVDCNPVLTLPFAACVVLWCFPLARPISTRAFLQVMGAEDFSYFMQARPGCFFFVASAPYECMSGAALPYADYHPPTPSAAGAAATAASPVSSVLPLVSGQYNALSNHRPDFDMDERCMPIGASIFVQLVLDSLGQKAAVTPSAASAATAAAPSS
jgi:metal-dependent amidase/aminoacylase/carboxypeptidase family protein